MKAYERLLSYVKIFTPSNEESTSSPSSRCQFDLARLLVEELKGLGISDVTLDDHCYVYAHICSCCKNAWNDKSNVCSANPF